MKMFLLCKSEGLRSQEKFIERLNAYLVFTRAVMYRVTERFRQSTPVTKMPPSLSFVTRNVLCPS